jgi:hypothetical protein
VTPIASTALFARKELDARNNSPLCPVAWLGIPRLAAGGRMPCWREEWIDGLARACVEGAWERCAARYLIDVVVSAFLLSKHLKRFDVVRTIKPQPNWD